VRLGEIIAVLQHNASLQGHIQSMLPIVEITLVHELHRRRGRHRLMGEGKLWEAGSPEVLAARVSGQLAPVS
jgi:hypothetical protein